MHGFVHTQTVLPEPCSGAGFFLRKNPIYLNLIYSFVPLSEPPLLLSIKVRPSKTNPVRMFRWTLFRWTLFRCSGAHISEAGAKTKFLQANSKVVLYWCKNEVTAKTSFLQASKHKQSLCKQKQSLCTHERSLCVQKRSWCLLAKTEFLQHKRSLCKQERSCCKNKVCLHERSSNLNPVQVLA